MAVNDTRTSGWFWLSVSVLLVSFAQLSLKFAMQQMPGEPGVDMIIAMIQPAHWFDVVLPIVLGMSSYVLSVVCWIGTLSRLPLSMAYPSLALSYLLVFAGAVLLPWFQEDWEVSRLVGIGCVIFGVWLVSLPPRSDA